MEHFPASRIQAEAATALATWKATFAERVISAARQLAREGNPEGLITVSHYRQAALSVLPTLIQLIQDTPSNDGRQEAA